MMSWLPTSSPNSSRNQLGISWRHRQTSLYKIMRRLEGFVHDSHISLYPDRHAKNNGYMPQIFFGWYGDSCVVTMTEKNTPNMSAGASQNIWYCCGFNTQLSFTSDRELRCRRWKRKRRSVGIPVQLQQQRLLGSHHRICRRRKAQLQGFSINRTTVWLLGAYISRLSNAKYAADEKNA